MHGGAGSQEIQEKLKVLRLAKDLLGFSRPLRRVDAAFAQKGFYSVPWRIGEMYLRRADGIKP